MACLLARPEKPFLVGELIRLWFAAAAEMCSEKTELFELLAFRREQLLEELRTPNVVTSSLTRHMF